MLTARYVTSLSLLLLETIKPAMSDSHFAGTKSTARGHLVVAWRTFLLLLSLGSPSLRATHLRPHVTLRTVCLCSTLVKLQLLPSFIISSVPAGRGKFNDHAMARYSSKGRRPYNYSDPYNPLPRPAGSTAIPTASQHGAQGWWVGGVWMEPPRRIPSIYEQGGRSSPKSEDSDCYEVPPPTAQNANAGRASQNTHFDFNNTEQALPWAAPLQQRSFHAVRNLLLVTTAGITTDETRCDPSWKQPTKNCFRTWQTDPYPEASSWRLTTCCATIPRSLTTQRAVT